MLLAKKLLGNISGVVLLTFAFLCTGNISAQSDGAAVLTPASRKMLTQIPHIGKGIPDSGWRYYVGDVPHGEDPALDDSAWTMKAGSYTLLADTAWFRKTLVAPASLVGYSIAGMKLDFRFGGATDGALSEIVYLDGRRIALGENLEAVVLADKIKPGQTFHLAVKLLHTTSPKRLSSSHFFVSPVGNRPNPVDFDTEVESAAITLPSLTTDPKLIAEHISLLSWR